MKQMLTTLILLIGVAALTAVFTRKASASTAVPRAVPPVAPTAKREEKQRAKLANATAAVGVIDALTTLGKNWYSDTGSELIEDFTRNDPFTLL